MQRMNPFLSRLFSLAVVAALVTGCSGGSGSGGGESVAPVSPAPVVTLTPQATKQFVFSWENFPAEAEYRLLENPDGLSGYTQVAVIPADSESYSHEVFLPERINASYILQACNSAGTCADSSEMFVTGNLADAAGYFKASNAEAYEGFGRSISISADGETLAVGAAFESSFATGIDGDQSDNSSSASGAVYVFSRTEAGWGQQAYLKASNTDENDRFGSVVALSSDGSTLAVGAPYEGSAATGVDGDQSDNSARESGAVYVFARDNDTWSQQAYLKASDASGADRFGSSVELSANGTTLGVSAPSAGVGNAGAVYVFEQQSGGWAEQAIVTSSFRDFGDRFGESIALSSDGDTLAVGATEEDSAATGIDGDQRDNSASSSGAVFVFVRSESGWGQEAYLKASNTAPRDLFGSSVSLSGNGDVLAVGATGEDSAAIGINGDQSDNSAAEAGAVYMFARTMGNWAQQAYLKASNTDEDDGFGFALSLSNEGQALAVGGLFETAFTTGASIYQSGNSDGLSGAVYLFYSIDEMWRQQAYIKSLTTVDAVDMPHTVALSGDATVLAVGAIAENGSSTGINGDRTDRTAPFSGAVFLY